jgi:RNA-directed DNA polymerase
MWLKAPVEERGKDGTKRISGGKNTKKGTPQGGVISPVLANRYMNAVTNALRAPRKRG